MATSHDSLLYQPEGDTGWSFGPFAVVKFLERKQFCWMSGSISSRELQLEAVGRHVSIIRSCGQSVESNSCKEDGNFFWPWNRLV